VVKKDNPKKSRAYERVFMVYVGIRFGLKIHKIHIKYCVVMVLFGCFFQQHMAAMHVQDGNGNAKEASSDRSVSRSGSQSGSEYFSLEDGQGLETGLSKKDMTALTLALGKMLNFSSWLELHYSIQAIITPYKGKSDERIQKYVKKWAISLEHARKITEKVVGVIIKALCRSKNIDLNKPDSTGFLPITLAAYKDDLFVTRVLLYAGVNKHKKDCFKHTALAYAQRFYYDSICTELMNS